MKARRKKCLAIFMLALMAVFMTTGCMRMSTDITFKNNGKCDLSMTVAALSTDDSSEDSTEAEIDEEEKEKYEKEGWTYTAYNQDGYTGYVVSKEDIDIDKLASEMNSGESDDYDINADSFIITKDGSRYNLNWAIGDSEDSADMDSYASYISSNDGYVRVVMTFPQKPISHNATSVSDDGKTLTWDLVTCKDDINVEFKLGGFNPLWIILILVFVAVLAGVLVLVIVLGKKKKNGAVPNGQPFDSNVYAQPGQAPQYDANGFGQQAPQQYGQPAQGYDPQQYAQPTAPAQPAAPQDYAQPTAPAQPAAPQDYAQPIAPAQPTAPQDDAQPTAQQPTQQAPYQGFDAGNYQGYNPNNKQ